MGRFERFGSRMHTRLCLCILACLRERSQKRTERFVSFHFRVGFVYHIQSRAEIQKSTIAHYPSPPEEIRIFDRLLCAVREPHPVFVCVCVCE